MSEPRFQPAGLGLVTHLVLALRNLRRNPKRTLLSLLP